jgi:hypothetical protein
MSISIRLALKYIRFQKIVVFLDKILYIKILHFQVDNIFTGSFEIWKELSEMASWGPANRVHRDLV